MSHQTKSSVGIHNTLGKGDTRNLFFRVTKQNQEFTLQGTNSDEFVDLELVNSSVQLVGEPGYGGSGSVLDGSSAAYDGSEAINYFTNHRNTFNELHTTNHPDFNSVPDNRKYKLYGTTIPNHINQDAMLDHGHVSVDFEGLSKESKYLTHDSSHADNNVNVVVPTDLGVERHRITLAASRRKFYIHRAKITGRVTIRTHFVGQLDEQSRTARFVKDWADEDPANRYRDDGTIKHFETYEQDPKSTEECIIPANMIESMMFTFKVIPRCTT